MRVVVDLNGCHGYGEGRSQILGVTRFNLVKQTRNGSRSRALDRRVDDEAVLVAIHAVTVVRPIYGYRRVTAIMN